MPASTGNILVFRVGQLGDTLVSLPAIHAIRQRHPRSRLILLTERQDAAGYVSSWDVLGPTGWFADLVFYRPARGFFSRLFTLLRLAWRLRRLGCETVYDLAPERTSTQSRRDRVFFGWFAGIHDYRGGGYLAKPGKDTGGLLPRIEPEWKRLLRVVGVDAKSDFLLPVPGADRRMAHERLARLGLPAGVRLLGVGAGSKMSSKIWPLERFREVGLRLLRDHPDIVLLVVGGRDDAERGDTLCRAWGSRAHNLAGELSPYGSAEVLRQCLAYLGNDTGVMHLAGMVGTPCVGLFSARDYPGQWEPYGEGHVVLRHETDCAGCMLDVCPYENRCLGQITAAEVMQSLEAILAQPRRVSGHQ